MKKIFFLTAITLLGTALFIVMPVFISAGTISECGIKIKKIEGSLYLITIEDNTSLSGCNSGNFFAPENDFEYMEIYSFKDLEHFASRVNSGEVRLNAKIMNDIDGGFQILPSIGSPEYPYSGLFDGNGMTVKNIMVPDGPCAGIFGCISDTGKVFYAVFDDITVSGSENAGAVAGINSGTILDVIVKNSFVSGVSCGGIAGTNYGMIINAYFSGKTDFSDPTGISEINEGEIINSYSLGEILSSPDEIAYIMHRENPSESTLIWSCDGENVIFSEHDMGIHPIYKLDVLDSQQKIRTIYSKSDGKFDISEILDILEPSSLKSLTDSNGEKVPAEAIEEIVSSDFYGEAYTLSELNKMKTTIRSMKIDDYNIITPDFSSVTDEFIISYLNFIGISIFGDYLSYTYRVLVYSTEIDVEFEFIDAMGEIIFSGTIIFSSENVFEIPDYDVPIGIPGAN